MQALYKLAENGVFDYESEGIQYQYKTCAEDEIESYVKAGWITEFAKLKGGNDGLQRKDEENKQEARQIGQEVLEPKRRGRKPKAE